MASPAFDIAFSALESRWISLDCWVKVWISLVVVGVIIELVVVAIEHREAVHEYKRGTIKSPAKPSAWKLFFGLLGAGLVAIGVAGELGAHFKASKLETETRTLSQQFIADAIKVASAADERTANTEKDNVQLQKDLEKEQQTTARAQKEAAEAQLAVKSYVDSIVKSANPRSKTFDSKRFAEIMKGVPPGIAQIGYEPDDSEARNFASIIRAALGPGGAGWVVTDIGPSPNGSGLDLLVQSRMRSDVPVTGDDLPIRATLIKAIKSGAGAGQDIPDFPRPLAALPDHVFRIVVGHQQFNVPLWIPPWQSATTPKQ